MRQSRTDYTYAIAVLVERFEGDDRWTVGDEFENDNAGFECDGIWDTKVECEKFIQIMRESTFEA